MVAIPNHIRDRVHKLVYSRADAWKYLDRSRTENGQFIDSLVDDPDIGGVLSGYFEPHAIRTYVKDAVLNRYSKDRRRPPEDLLPYAVSQYGTECVHHGEGLIGEAVQLFSCGASRLVVASVTSLLKWETGIRKALEFSQAAPGLPPEDGSLDYLLVVVTGGAHVVQSDRRHLTKVMGQLGWRVAFTDTIDL